MAISWKSAQSGSWNVAANWSPTQVPASGDDVLINLPGAYLVAVGAATVQTLTLDDGDGELQVNGPLTITDTLSVNAGTLDITLTGAVVAIDLANTGTIVADGQLNVRGRYDVASLRHIGGTTGALALQGTLANSGGTFDASSLAHLTIFALGSIDGGTVVGLSQSGESNLNAVTWQGPLNLAGRHLTIENGLIVANPLGFLPGSVDLGTGGTLDFSGDQVFDHVNVANPGTITAEQSLTLGSAFSLTQTTNSTGLVISGPGTIVNQGVVSLLGSPISKISHTLGVILVAEFENDGTLAATSLGTITNGLDSFFNITSGAFHNGTKGVLEALGGGIAVSTATNFINDGTVLANAGTIDIAPLVAGSGVMALQDNGTLELGSAVTAGQVVDFLDSGVLVLDQPVFFAGTIGHIGTGDVIRLGLPAIGVGYEAGMLEMQSTGGQNFSLSIPGATGLSDFMINTGSTNTTIELACFAAGTRIATEHGEVRVEAVREGDLVRLAGSDALLSVVWVGHRRVNCRRHPKPMQVWPVRIAAHAFARNVPRRELRLSPDHAVLVDGVLVPIKYLVNGTSVAQVRVDIVVYHHVELSRHAVMLAEGLAAESFLGARDAFVDGGLPLTLYPDFSSRLWEAAACAPLVVTGAKVAAMQARLAQRARGMTVGVYSSPTKWDRSAQSAG